MVSDQEIAKGVEILLSQSDPKSFTTLSDVVHQLGQKLGFDLSHKAVFIRDQINLLLFRSQSHHQHPPTPQPPPPPQSSVTTSGIAKDHFALQQQQQHAQYHFTQPQHHVHPPPSQFHHAHFVHQQQQQQIHQQQQQQQHQQQQQRQRHPVELNFSKPSPPSQAVPVVPSPSPQQSQLQPLPEAKVEGGVVVQDVARKSSEKPKKAGSTGTKRRGGPGGLNKLCGITPELQVIVGESALSRTDIVKQLWAYIKKNNLQDPGNKRKIICDDALRVVFETDCTDMFKMNKLLAKHIIRLEPTKESSRKKSKVNVDPVVEDTNTNTNANTDVVTCQVIISEALANCLGTVEREMSQSEALRLVWEYIKVNNLEDPGNPVMIVCDEKLKELFGCESISAMGIPELLVSHHLFEQ
ncbi:hypothetical protein L2E82_31376 [Cichorium intybus]|uniref:Uncharacterized protein n=1 Tax=Cichorium intybus TaxID=13427 RepID=A0ACB9D347_CICIN|nr:hypothetical protein L2E82_31376 [Cichorium intybus]